MATSLLFCISIILLAATPAHAYIGPGMGAGAIAAFVGIVVSIVLAVVGVIWYPFKRFMKKRKANKANEQD